MTRNRVIEVIGFALVIMVGLPALILATQIAA